MRPRVLTQTHSGLCAAGRMIVGPPRARTGLEGGPRGGQPARVRRGRRPPRPGHRAVGAGQSRGRPTWAIPQSGCGLGTSRSAARGSAGSVRQSGDKALKQVRAKGPLKAGQPQRRAERVAGRRSSRQHSVRPAAGQRIDGEPAG